MADRDYYSTAFLDWFPGNIQHLNSIASVLHYPLAARQQNNETADRAGAQKQDALLHSPAFHAGRHWSPPLLPHAPPLVTQNETNRPAAGSQQSLDSQQIRRRRINIHARCGSDFTLTDVSTSDFMMKVNSWFHYKPIDYKMGRRANSLISLRSCFCVLTTDPWVI